MERGSSGRPMRYRFGQRFAVTPLSPPPRHLTLQLSRLSLWRGRKERVKCEPCRRRAGLPLHRIDAIDATTLGLPLINRESSRLDYITRVLSEARRSQLPVLERLRFLTYCSRNLDEFFMVRAGSIRDLIDSGRGETSIDGLTPEFQMAFIRIRAAALQNDIHHCLNSELLPLLAGHGVVISSSAELPDDVRSVAADHFVRNIAPVLTPLAIDPGHPFPFLANLAINLALVLHSEVSGDHLVVLKLPGTIPRFLDFGTSRFITIESLVRTQLHHFFPSFEVRRAVVFRVIRNSELSLDDDEVEDLRDSVEAELRRRERKQVVCLEIEKGADEALVRILAQGTRTLLEDVYRVDGLVKVGDLTEICDRVTEPHLHFPPFNPRLPQRLAAAEDIFSIIRRGDVLIHRPYESFMAVVELLHAAAVDPDVLAIKQTLYQTDQKSPVVNELVLAALSGKQVAVVIELQARFEERRNLAFAARLRDAGVQVVYGIVGMQTHVKMALIVRREDATLRRYVHLSTGNYNIDSARAYTDLDLLTSAESFGSDAAQVMNLLTGFSVNALQHAIELEEGRPKWDHFVLAPMDYQRWLLGMIDREIAHAQSGHQARIAAKLNSLVDPEVIRKLYEASRSGVRVDLVIRSICSLVPGLAGISDNIRVTSVLGRYLEHSRIVSFANGGAREVYLSSGDWMPRNFTRRVEVTFPLLDPQIRARAEWILETTLADGTAWELRSDLTWARRDGSHPAAQDVFAAEARAEAVAVGPFEVNVEKVARKRRTARRGKRQRA